MKHWKRILCLLIVLSLFAAPGTAALAADDAPSAPGDLLGDVLDALRGGTDTPQFHFPAEWAEGKEKISNFDYAALGESLKTILETSKDLSDEELYDAVSRMAGERGLPLVDSQIRQLCNLCRSLEKLNADELKSRLEDLLPTQQGDTDENAEPEPEESSGGRKKLSGVLRFLRNAADKAVRLVRRFFDRIKKKA